MKLPDLAVAADAGVREWSGAQDAIKAAAAAANLKYRVVDLHGIGGKNELMAALAKGLKLPEHFGNNWDALADCLEDSEWLGTHGIVVVLRHAGRVVRAIRSRASASRTVLPPHSSGLVQCLPPRAARWFCRWRVRWPTGAERSQRNESFAWPAGSLIEPTDWPG